MSIEENKYGNITGIVSKVVKISDDKLDKEIRQVMEMYARLVTACPHTFKEIKKYFLEQCDAMPIALNDERMDLFKSVVIMKHFKDKEHKAPRFSDMTNEEIAKWHKEKSDMFYDAHFESPQQYGLNLHGYYLPYTKRNEVFYNEVYSKFKNCTYGIDNRSEMDDICFFFEETTGDYYFTCPGCSLMYKVIIFIGISEEDIKKRNQRFLTYFNAMVQMGYLPKLY